MTFAETVAATTRIACAQSELLDHTGHVQRGMARATSTALVAEINALRAQVGWKPLDMTGRYRLF